MPGQASRFQASPPCWQSWTATLTLSNAGGLVDLEFEVFEKGGAQTAAALPVAKVAPSVSSVAPQGWVNQTVTRQVNGGSVAVFMDALPWGSDGLLQVLDNVGAVYDLYTSTDMATVNLTPYQAVFISNDQPQG